MDYNVFVVSRIKEAHDRGMPTSQAVAHGIRTTAGVVTSAAIIMVAVFAVFGTLSLQQFKQLSVGLAVAVLLHATMVRGVLLPSAMIPVRFANRTDGAEGCDLGCAFLETGEQDVRVRYGGGIDVDGDIAGAGIGQQGGVEGSPDGGPEREHPE